MRGLAAWMERMLQEPAVAAYSLDTATHAQFVASIATGAPNYNLLSEAAAA